MIAVDLGFAICIPLYESDSISAGMKVRFHRNCPLLAPWWPALYLWGQKVAQHKGQIHLAFLDGTTARLYGKLASVYGHISLAWK